ncbi:MAG TPA: hypothetical protein VGH14_12085 [Solirubrobacterales bacterium]
MPRKTMSRLLAALVACGLLFAVLAPSAFARFGIASFDGEVTRNAAGDPDTQAGSHPFEVSTTINFNLREGKEKGTMVPDGNVRDVDVELPAGLIGDPSATERCTAAQFAGGFNNSCPDNTQVGVTSLTVLGGKTLSFPVFNLVPPPGTPALFGFVVLVDPVTATATVRPAENGGNEGYGLDIHLENISQGLPLEGTSLTFWGNPSDEAHNAERGVCLSDTSEGNPLPPGGCPYKGTGKPFMTLPTSCTGPQTTRLHVTSWTGQEDRASFTTHGKAGEPLGADGCDLVPFAPSISTALDSATADSPSGLAVNVHIPQNTNPEGLASANLKSTAVTLPAGISINPSTANGLVGCSVGQFDQFSEAASSCPQNSKIGTVGIETPLLPVPIEGGIYLARQTENPFGTLIAIYLVGEADGVRVKLPGKIELDPATGRLVTTFDNTPQVPFSNFKLHFFSGPSAVLATPVVCGTQASTASLTSWSGGAPIAAASSVTVSSAPNGGACATSPNQRPFGLSLEAGTQSSAAATHSPFTFQVNRADGNQEIGGINATLPLGVLPVLKGVPPCGDAAASAGTCGAASQVGTVTVGAGAGTNPFYVRTGRMYLTGPYKGAPYGLDFVVPAVAGPLDLGTVNVRAAAFVDPTTAQVTIKADELPHILDGIPLRIRSLRLDANRPGFIVNPTSCNPLQVTAQAISTEGATANLSDRFQAAGCNQLGFQPTLAPKLLGGRKATKRRSHPPLQVTVKEPKGQANLSSVALAVPNKIPLDQSHIKIVCTRVQFAAKKCPAASVYGTAKVTTPLLAQPLQGPVYLRSSNNKLPDLVIDLKGQIEIVLDGRIDNKGGGIRTVFSSVPDAPISTFTLTMKGGKRGLLVNSVDLCKHPAKALVKTTGQNGAVHNFNPALATSCGGRRK